MMTHHTLELRMGTHEPEQRFTEYVNLVRTLRRECPWDREQTHQSIRQSLIEEAYEVVEAIDHNHQDELKKELGDLLLHVTLHSVMAEEKDSFTIDDVLMTSMEKLIRRHPHVFGETKAHGAAEVKQNWEKIKMSEGRQSVTDGIPKDLPALQKAYRLQDKASRVGFDWKQKDDVWKKVEEEIIELKEAERRSDPERIEEELGDLLFALVNYARFLNVNPESALRKANSKFSKRIRSIEEELGRRGKKMADSTLEEMDGLWNDFKKR